MKKKLFRNIFAVTIISIVATIFFAMSTMAANGIETKINALRNKYPDGYFWNHKVTTNSNNGDQLRDRWDESFSESVTTSPCKTHKGTAAIGQYDCNFFDGGIQCFGFARRVFYDIFGVRASAMSLRYDAANIQVGDCIRINNDTHSAVVIARNGNTLTLVEANLDLSGAAYNCKIRWGATCDISKVTYFHRASNYDTVKGAVSWKNSATKVNLGDDFYARIINTGTGKALVAESNGNVAIYDLKNSADQIWRFTRNGDGTYTVINKNNGMALDVNGASTQASTNVQIYTPIGSTAQKWSIYGSQGNYFLSADCTDCVVDIQGSATANGTNVIMFTKHGASNQLFTIEKINAPSKPSLNISSNGKLTTFKWTKVSNADSYELKIMKDGSTYKTVANLTSDSTTVDLPNGIYTAVLTAKNSVYKTDSVSYNFTVNYNSVNSADWQYAVALPSGVTTDKYVIEYKHTYEKVAKSSPGNGWVKGNVAKQVYENSGDVYYSTLPLETSATRVLVNYSYYHWCSKSKGDEVNYDSTSVFSHYDGVNANNVYEFYSHADYADSRYTFYGLKYKDSNNYVYCNSGTTCDGSYGTHGNRSYYWYKMYAYQDKTAVSYYTYTKQGEWTTVKDSAAASYTVRYKLIEKNDCSAGHTYKTTTTKATLSKNGKVENKCSVCGYVKSSTVYYPKTITLSKTEYTYNGKAQKPTVTVKDSKGNTLKKDTDYKVTYEKGRKNPGKYTVRIDFMGKYSGTKRVYFTIAPAVPVLAKTSQSTNAIRLTWNKVTGATGYRVYQYNSKTKKWDKLKTLKDTTYRIEKLKAGTTYKFRVKAYKKDGETIWGKATSTITVATKPATPKITKLTTTKGKVNLTWSNVSGENGYQVYYSSEKNGGYKKLGTFKADVLKGAKSKLKSGKKYYFKVRAYKKTASGTVYSAWSAVKSIKIK